MVVFVCVIILFDFIVRCSATSPYIFELAGDRENGAMLRGDTSPSLLVKQPFMFRIYFDAKVKKIWCSDKNYETKFFDLALKLVQSKPCDYYASEKMIIATKAMEGIWKCTIRIQSDKDNEDKRFEINVDVTKPEMITEPTEEEEVLEVEPADTHRAPKYLANSPYINATIYLDRKKLILRTKSMVELNKPFNITLHFKKDVLKRNSITRIICYNTLRKTEIHVNENLERIPGKSNIYIAKVDRGAANMEGNWTCEIKASDGSIPIKLTFPVAFESLPTNPPPLIGTSTTARNLSSPKKGIAPLNDDDAVTKQKTVELLVNNVKIDTKVASRKEPSINAKGEYFYRDGELVKISCRIIAGKSLSGMKMAYYYQNVTDKTIVNIDEHIRNTSKQTMHLKLTTEHGSHFTCTQLSSPTYAVRLSFYKNTDINSDELILQVNGLKLSSINDTDTLSTAIYTYEYYAGEKLHIVGSMAKRSNKWNCILGADSEQLNAITDQHERIDVTVTLAHDKLAPSSVNCQAGDRSVRLTLAPVITVFDPDLSGLSLAKTLLKYQKSQRVYFTKYNYAGSVNMHLTCKSNYKNCKWDINATETISMGDLKFEENNTNGYLYISKIMLKPIKTFPKTIVKCKCYDDSKIYANLVEIINENFKPDVPQLEVTSSTPPNSPSDEPNTEQDKDKPMKTELLIGIILGTVLLVVLVAWIIVGIHKRKRRLEKAQESILNYENLPEHNKGAMATPAVWDIYSQPLNSVEETYSEPYIEKDVEQMYAKPQPKWQRQPNEAHYAEVGAQEPNTEYANIGRQQETPGYTQVQKMPRNDTCTPQVLPLSNNENYAQVLPKNKRRTIESTNKSAYTNQTYVNAQDKSDYAEPAYCEVDSNKKIK